MYIGSGIDIILGIFFDSFPLINYVMRCFIILFLVKKLRNRWLYILNILWSTKTVLFILFFNICVFSVIANILFGNINKFETFLKSFEQMFILMITCNFPDIMISTYIISKFSIIFFVIYLIMNYFMILSLLKALYYSNYLELYKLNTENKLNQIKNKIIKLDKTSLVKQIFYITKKCSLTSNEFNKLINIVSLNNTDFDYNFLTFSQVKKDDRIIRNHSLLYYLRLKRVEILVNCINLFLLAFFFY